MPHHILLLKGPAKPLHSSASLRELRFRNVRPLHGKRVIIRKHVSLSSARGLVRVRQQNEGLVTQCYVEGKPDKISRRNIKFFYGCAIIDARRNIASLIDQANKKYPGKPYYNLIISVDFTVIPTAYTLQPIEEFDFSQCTMNGPPTRARTEAMIEKVQKNPGTFALVATTVVVGLTVRSFMAIVPYDVWEGFPGGGPPALAGLSHSGPSGPLGGSHAPGRTESNQPDLFEGFMKAMNELWEQEGNFLDDE